VTCVAGEQVEGVGKEGKDCAEGAFGSARASGEIEDKAGARNSANAAAEGCVGCVEAAVLADELGEAGDESITDGERGFWGDIAGGETGAAGGEDEGGAGGSRAQGGNELRGFVGDNEGVQKLCAGLGKDAGEGRAGEVDLGAGCAAVADGEDDRGATGEGGLGLHVSRIDASARNVAGDEKMKKPASF
jgi:hypothetical protein